MTRKRIESIGDIRAHCVSVGNCWEWAYTPGVDLKGQPSIQFKGKHCTVLRAGFMLLHKFEPADLEGLLVWAGCGNKRCVCPGHGRAGNKAALMRWRAEQGLNQISLAAKANITKGIREHRGVMFTMDDARAIRAAQTSLEEEARQRSCSANLIWQIRRGLLYRETVAASSVFSLAGTGLTIPVQEAA